MRNIFRLNLIAFVLLFLPGAHAQIGVNTTTPAGGSILDIESADKGLLIPRIDIANLNTIAPVTGGAPQSLLVWNTNTTTGEGFYYWSGTRWVTIDGFRDWRLEGNAGTNPGTAAGENYIGTSDNRRLIIATNAANKLIIPSGSNQIFAANRGNNSLPFYSWEADPNTGIWSSGSDRVNFTAGAREMLEMREAGNSSVIVFNDGSQDTDVRMESDANTNMFFLNAANSRIGIGTGAPNATLEIRNPNSTNNSEILRLGMERVFRFMQFNTGPDTGLELNSVTDNKPFRITNSRREDVFSLYASSDFNQNIVRLVPIRGRAVVGSNANFPTFSHLLTVDGSASKPGGGTWSTFSDRRLKKNINDYTDGLDKVLQINPKTYQYNGKAGTRDSGKTHYGVIAQEIQRVAPYTVEEHDTDEFKRLRSYDGTALTYMLINAVKEQQAQIEELKKEIKKLKRR